MSTDVDMCVDARWWMTKALKEEKAGKKPLRDASGTRMRILEAAQLRFCEQSYEQVGVREIAADAGIDAALINRYFGTKQDLFAEISKGVFSAENFIGAEPDQLGDVLARRLMGGTGKAKAGVNPFELLLRSAASPTASPIIANRLHEDFVLRLAALIGGKHASTRAALIASYLIGFLTVRVALQSPAILPPDADKVVALLGSAIQAAIDDRQ
jgi:AcrR family transcriptional regulator